MTMSAIEFCKLAAMISGTECKRVNSKGAAISRFSKLAQRRGIAAVRKFEINPVSTSPRAMARYRNLALIAPKAAAN